MRKNWQIETLFKIQLLTYLSPLKYFDQSLKRDS